MPISTIKSAAFASYTIEVEINSTREIAWTILTNRIEKWWPDDFRMLGHNSKIALELVKGGRLSEKSPDGAYLEWYRVQMFTPQTEIHLIGEIGSAWGGPKISMLGLKLTEDGNGCSIHLTDALLGNITQKNLEIARDGWQTILENGFRTFCETAVE